MAKKNGLKNFYVSAKILVEANKLVEANTLEEAVAKSKDLTYEDFIEIIADEHLDSEFKVTGVYHEWKSVEL